MDLSGPRITGTRVMRLLVLAATIASVLVPRLHTAAEPLVAPSADPSRPSSLERLPRAQLADDGRPCESQARWDGLSPLIQDAEGDIEALWATSDARNDLLSSKTLYVRVDVKQGVPIHRLLLDVDLDRSTGMWTGQSHLSDSGWDRLVDPAGVLYRHGAEHPNRWEWNSVKSPKLRTVQDGNRYYFCIPLEDVPVTDRISITAENSRNSMPRRFLRGAVYPAMASVLKPSGVRPPKRMAFYYSGSPWIVRNCTDYDQTQVDCAARVFKKFRHVVFGARLEEETRGGHVGAANLMQRLRKVAPKTELWGYISFIGSQKNADGRRDHVYPVEEYAQRAAQWKAMGATGIFLDEYDVCDPSWQSCRPGPDGEGVLLTRQRQIKIVQSIHSLGLAVFANSHSVQNALAEIEGQPTPLGGPQGGRPADMYLLENPTVVFGKLHEGINREAHMARFAQALELTQATKVRLGVLDSMPGLVPDSANTWTEYRLGWWQAAQAGAVAYALHHTEGLAVLKPPPDAPASFAGLHFDAEGIRFLDDAAVAQRAVLDCLGKPVASITRRLMAAGTEVAGLEPLGSSTLSLSC